jgi:(R,R)-butanediol dehydrogenase / meso-butanediol dehydrogenase / diacetyl reductase
MRAAVYHGPGDVRIEAVPDPPQPRPGDVLVDVLRAAICGTDSTEYVSGPKLIPVNEPHPGSGHVGPVVLGHEFVGRVRAVGDAVDGFAVGDRIVSGAGVSCGECDWCRAGRTNLCARYYTLGFHIDGGLAEAVRTPAHICVPVPDVCSDEAAAMAQPLAVALHALNRGGLRSARQAGMGWLVVIGVGGIGAFVVGGAVARSIRGVIAIDVDPQRLETARVLGADHLVNAEETDAAAAVRDVTGGEGAHVVIEASGAPGSPDKAIKMARRGGRVVIVGLQGNPAPVDLFDLAFREIEMTSALAHVCAEDLPEALEILATTAFADIVLDRVIPLDRLVPDGLMPLAEGRARGKIVVDPTRQADA